MSPSRNIGDEVNILKPLPTLLLLITAVSFVKYSMASAQETKYFTDVTETHVPQDAFAHLLDAESIEQRRIIL
ncbi:hypothetical protein [Thalassoroseus pseudoceratinae]|uniref:hypothetical protein n=1 Tax=Thalassoroseus pseudoceratinae TaxID=2713176 RepID=UPI0014238848|nr:hypothetical protein [Thalassoroseus pseudoceratinae]